MFSSRVVGLAASALLLSSCGADDGNLEPEPTRTTEQLTAAEATPAPQDGFEVEITRVDDGKVYPAPWTYFEHPFGTQRAPTPDPTAMLSPGTRVTIRCEAYDSHDQPTLFYKISYPGGTGYVRNTSVRAIDPFSGANIFTLIKPC